MDLSVLAIKQLKALGSIINGNVQRQFRNTPHTFEMLTRKWAECDKPP
jgi:hypothetical protein